MLVCKADTERWVTIPWRAGKIFVADGRGVLILEVTQCLFCCHVTGKNNANEKKRVFHVLQQLVYGPRCL